MRNTRFLKWVERWDEHGNIGTMNQGISEYPPEYPISIVDGEIPKSDPTGNIILMT